MRQEEVVGEMLNIWGKRSQAAATAALALVMLGSTSWLAAQEPGDDDFAELELEELIEGRWTTSREPGWSSPR